MVEIDETELKQLKKENRVLSKKLKRAQSDLESFEQSKRNQESLHRQVILELEDSQATLETQKEELEALLQDLRKTQKQLIEAEKLSALGQLVAGVAHEINTPVGTSITLVSTLMDETAAFSKITQGGALKRSHLNHFIEVTQEATHLIFHNLNRAGELVQTFKKVAVDQSNQEQRIFEVTGYLQEVGKSLMPYVKKGGHKLTIEGPELFIDGYPGLFAQIITNFMMNSLHHAFAGNEVGQLDLKIHSHQQQLTLIYKDNGCGIATEDLGKVYEPFYTTARQTGGTGLGLHIVYNIVTQTLQGQIQLNSVLGEGTEFIVTVPIKPATPQITYS